MPVALALFIARWPRTAAGFILLAVLLIAGLLPLAAFAADGASSAGRAYPAPAATTVTPSTNSTVSTAAAANWMSAPVVTVLIQLMKASCFFAQMAAWVRLFTRILCRIALT